jgi:hypothetical protein
VFRKHRQISKEFSEQTEYQLFGDCIDAGDKIKGNIRGLHHLAHGRLPGCLKLRESLPGEVPDESSGKKTPRVTGCTGTTPAV